MHKVGQLLKPIEKKSASSERADLIGFFTDTLNATRDGKRFKTLPYSAIAAKLAYLSLHDLYFLKSTCLEAERRGYPFSAIFWKEIKPTEA